MDRPKEIENRFEKKIIITLQSFSPEKLIEVQEKIKSSIFLERVKQEGKEKEKYVWINTMMEVKK